MTVIRFGALSAVAVAVCCALVVPAFAANDPYAAPTASALRHVAATQKALPPYKFSYLSTSTVWVTTDANGWVAGYLPGELWLGYQITGDPVWRDRAISRERPLGSLTPTSGTLDIGQRYFYSYAEAYRMTGNTTYRNVALRQAAMQAARFDPTVGALRSRNATDSYQVIIDDIMNAQLLFWGARNGGPAVWRDMAHTHALTVARDFIRPDGSTYHLIKYEPDEGEVVEKTTAQGYSSTSMWSRGQAWGIYGLTSAFRETADTTLVVAACRVADRYIADLPTDTVPYWDFRAPNIPDEPRDSSAAAAAASGLIDLATLAPDPADRARYAAAARATLASLSTPAYSTWNASASVLAHGTLNHWSNTHEVGLSFGDYFYLEAMLRARRLPSDLPAQRIRRVTASKGSPRRAIDSNANNAWTGTGKQWIVADMGKRVTAHAVSVALTTGASRSVGVKVAVSFDGKHWRTVAVTRSMGDTKLPETYAFNSARARYVRVTLTPPTKKGTFGVSSLTVR